MTKLEKVIKGLECCITDGPDCPNDCPYIGNCNRKQLHTDGFNEVICTNEEFGPRCPVPLDWFCADGEQKKQNHEYADKKKEDVLSEVD